MASPTGPSARADATRDALIEAALIVFARDGFEAASTRAIADEASVNQALIGYHFKGKQGLYLAVFESIVARMRERVGDRLEAVVALAASLDPAAPEARGTAVATLQAFATAMVMTVVRPETAAWSQLILREQQAPSQAFDILYTGFMDEILGAITKLVQVARPDVDGEEVRLLVITIMGQIMALRMARAGATRLLDWSVITPERAAAMAARVNANIAALLAGKD